MSKPFFKKGKWFVSPFNFDKNVMAGFKFPEGNRVYVEDSTIRKINYGTGLRVSIEDRVKIALKMEELGVDVVPINYPLSKDTYDLTNALSKERFKFKIRNTILCYPERVKSKQYRNEIDRAVEGGADEVMLNMTSPLKHLPPIPIERYLSDIEEVVQYANDKKIPFELGFPEITRCDLDKMIRILDLSAKYGPTSIWLADTVGCGSPDAIKYLFGEIISRMTTKIPLVLHAHDTFGQASMATVASVTAGAKGVDVVMSGLADHSGLARLEDVVMTLEALYGISTGLNLEKLEGYAKVVERVTGIRQPISKSIIGEGTFTLELPYFVSAILRGEVELPLVPDVVGRKRKVVWGRNTFVEDGDETIKAKLDNMGVKYSQSDVAKISEIIRAKIEKKESFPYWLDEFEVEEICRSVLH